MAQEKIIWTHIDEAPALATYSLLPIVNAFTKVAGIEVQTRDISLAGRVLAAMKEYLSTQSVHDDALSELGELTLNKEANIIKLPNISASIPQLIATIKELQSQGYSLPAYPENPQTDDEKKIKELYSKCLGSAVNPVLREGNSDRRCATSVKNYAKKNPHKLSSWSQESQAHVACMSEGDFYGNEKSTTLTSNTTLTIEFVDNQGRITPLKEGLQVHEGEIVDATFMSKVALRTFYANQIDDAKNTNLLFSLHLKATMMKVSDPIMFGHCVEVFYQEIFEKYNETFQRLGVNPNNGLGDVYAKISQLPENERQAIENDIQNLYNQKPALAMVDSDKGITNLHVPNDIIIDASMPVVIRDGGKMWNRDGKLADCKAVIPDRCYATMYQEVIRDCQKYGAFDVTTMGSVSNVGLMAQKAEEYGSHPTTFEIPHDGDVYVKDSQGNILFHHHVEQGDIWRMSRVKDIPVQDWIKLAIQRAKLTQTPAVFWLDEHRAHDNELIKKVTSVLNDSNMQGIEIHILAPEDAMKFSLNRIRQGLDTISVTGNVLRDYLTDLFPILELGTSAKMLSIVPLLAGGGLFETGAGGSAPKHVQQFLEEGYLRWDSLGEFLALGVSLEHLGNTFHNSQALILAKTLDQAIEGILDNNKSPARKVGSIDNRGSHFYLAYYWAKALATQEENHDLKKIFTSVAKALEENEEKINHELINAQGKPQDIGGYYHPDRTKVTQAMRPSHTLNTIIDTIAS